MWHDSFLCVTWLLHMCDVTYSYVWRDSFMCQMTPFICDIRHVTSLWHTHVPRHMCHERSHIRHCVWWDVSHINETYVKLRKHACNMRKVPYDMHSYVWHDLFICVTWFLHVSNDSIHNACPLVIGDMGHVTWDVFEVICASGIATIFACVRHDSLMCVTCLIAMWHDPFLCVCVRSCVYLPPEIWEATHSDFRAPLKAKEPCIVSKRSLNSTQMSPTNSKDNVRWRNCKTLQHTTATYCNTLQQTAKSL